MLLLPFGIDPKWVSRGELNAPGLAYGLESEDVPDGVLVLSFDPSAPSFFEDDALPPVERMPWCRCDGGDWPLPFGTPERPDLVASAFLWLSGWQEHVVRERDEFGRFPHEASLQKALGVTRRPVVDAYRALLANRLRAHGLPAERRSWQGRPWALCPTHDIDYVRKWRPGIIYREVMHYLLLGRRDRAWRDRVGRFGRSVRQAARMPDPYRAALTRLRTETERRGGTSTYFFKAGEHGPRDVGYRLEQAWLHAEGRALREAGFEVGLHPSYHAHTHSGYLQEERRRLEVWLGAAPVAVRQHYLRYEAPRTTRLHEEAGFCIDSTLGFASVAGFRHGTCLPFLIYDLEADRPTGVWEMPLVMMDGALFVWMGLGLEEALEVTGELMAECRRFGGVAVGLWHNMVWDEEDFPEWGAHFTATLDRARSDGAAITSLRQALIDWMGYGI